MINFFINLRRYKTNDTMKANKLMGICLLMAAILFSCNQLPKMGADDEKNASEQQTDPQNPDGNQEENPEGGDDNPGGGGEDNPGGGEDNPGGGEDNPGGGETEASIEITPNEIALGWEEADFEITVTAINLEYDITIVDEWISLASREGEPATGEKLVFHAQSNPDYEPRDGVISICSLGADGTCIPVMIAQEGQPEPEVPEIDFTCHVLAMRFTATWCGYCPYMDEAFHAAAEQREDFEFVTFHASKGYPLYFADCKPLVTAYKVDGFPTGILGGWKAINNSTTTSTTVNFISNQMDNFLTNFPCTVGINTSAVIADGKVEVTTWVKSTVAQTYKIAALVLESGIVETQTYYPPTGNTQKLKDFEHDHVARKLLTESIQGDEFTLDADGAVCYTWQADLDASWNPENLSIAVWILQDYGEELASLKAKKAFPDNFIMNARVTPVGE